MKICVLGKFPPIEGGVSRDNFWTSWAWASQGIEVHVVTNAREVEPDFRMYGRTTGWTGGQDWDAELPPSPLANKPDCLHVHDTEANPRIRYIPYANPYVTKLSSTAARVVEDHGCELIYGYYFEPYGLAAHLASRWTNVPYGVRHAGSDVGRLMQVPALRTAYMQMIRRADFLIAGQAAFRRFMSAGVDFDRIYTLANAGFMLPTQYFHPSARPLDVAAYLEQALEDMPEECYEGFLHRLGQKKLDPEVPCIGIYGKPGEGKGTYDLCRALAILKDRGLKLQFLALVQGRPQDIRRFRLALEQHRLEEVTWVLPYMPHWRVPHFIRACTAVCFLERDFSIPSHQPIVPREVTACGTCLVVSGEIEAKQRYKGRMAHGENVYVVDPKDHEALADTLEEVISDPARARHIGERGYEELARPLEDFDRFVSGAAERLKTIHEDVHDRRSTMSIAEMQASLARLYMDELFRQRFFDAPEDALASYKLSDEEKRSLKAIDKKVLTYFAHTLKGKRLRRIQQAYPLLFELIPREAMNRYSDRYHQLHIPKPQEALFDRIVDFGLFISETLGGDDDVPPYASDLARYEMAYYQSRFKPSFRDTLGRVNEASAGPSAGFDLDACYIMDPDLQVETFHYDMIQIVEARKDHETPGDELLVRGSYFIVFQQLFNSLRPAVFEINEGMKNILDLCDGRHTVREITDELEKQLQMSNLTPEVQEAIAYLLDKQLILAKGQPPA